MKEKRRSTARRLDYATPKPERSDNGNDKEQLKDFIKQFLAELVLVVVGIPVVILLLASDGFGCG